MSNKKDNRATVEAARVNSKGRIIAAIIGGIFVITVAVFQYRKSFEPSKAYNEMPITSTDSSSQMIIQNEQKNSNNGDVTNEYIFGDKNINQSAPESEKPKSNPKNSVKPKQFEETTTKIEKIENNGNLSIGQTGGTVNQTTIINPKPAPRQLTEKIIQTLQDTIPKDFTVDVNHPMADEESTNFALGLLTSLQNLGYKTTRSIYGQIIPDLNQSYSLGLDHNSKKAEIIVYKLK